jgi:hypothetical protein
MGSSLIQVKTRVTKLSGSVPGILKSIPPIHMRVNLTKVVYESEGSCEPRWYILATLVSSYLKNRMILSQLFQ